MSKNREKPYWEGKKYSFFQNTECEYFPCHRIADPEQFNCLFCYCPLYMMGTHCGGNFRYNSKGIKDCTDCVIPHLRDNYGRIIGKYKDIQDMMFGREAADRIGSAKNKESDMNTQTEIEDIQRTDRECTRIESADTDNKDGHNSAAHDNSRNVPCIVMMACTERGFETMRTAAAAFAEKFPDVEILQTGRCAHVPGFEDGPRLSELTKQWFSRADALIFFTATGIAVRCIAPFVLDKFRDPAVLAVDENGRYVISLMSGHAGGANRLCGLLANALGAQPIITTATDGRGLFAVDIYAAENGLILSDRTIAKQISSHLLAGAECRIFFDAGMDAFEKRLENCGEGVLVTADRGCADVIVSCRYEPGDKENALYLIPQMLTLGIGCRKGIGADAIEKAVSAVLQSEGIFRQAIAGIASVDLKEGETGLHAFVESRNLPLCFYRAEELNRLPGTYSSSEFVQSVAGVDCVCERSAVRLALDMTARIPKMLQISQIPQEEVAEAFGKHVRLLVKKQSLDGVTAAIAMIIS